MELRLAQLSELPALNHLIALSAERLSLPFYTPEQIASANKHVFGVDTQLIMDGTYFVVLSDDSVVGCGGWSKRNTLYGGDQMKSAADPLLDPNLDAARIRAFFVHPSWARQGIATRILEACLHAARSAGFRRAELVATLPGEPFYAAAGFTVIERLPTRLPDGVLIDFVKMGKPI